MAPVQDHTDTHILYTCIYIQITLFKGIISNENLAVIMSFLHRDRDILFLIACMQDYFIVWKYIPHYWDSNAGLWSLLLWKWTRCWTNILVVSDLKRRDCHLVEPMPRITLGMSHKCDGKCDGLIVLSSCYRPNQPITQYIASTHWGRMEMDDFS